MALPENLFSTADKSQQPTKIERHLSLGGDFSLAVSRRLKLSICYYAVTTPQLRKRHPVHQPMRVFQPPRGLGEALPGVIWFQRLLRLFHQVLGASMTFVCVTGGTACML